MRHSIPASQPFSQSAGWLSYFQRLNRIEVYFMCNEKKLHIRSFSALRFWHSGAKSKTKIKIKKNEKNVQMDSRDIRVLSVENRRTIKVM